MFSHPFVVLMLCLATAFKTDSSNVCFPSFEKRAFVTTLSNRHDNLLKIQVLYKSLRMNKAKEDVVVIVPETLLTSTLRKDLSSFGFIIYPIKKKSMELHPNAQGLSIWAFEMIQYERLVYLDPYSLVLEGVHELFACAGYCASLNSKKSPVVLEPSMQTFTSLTQNFYKQNADSDFMVALQLIMNVESCPMFSQQVVVNAETREQCFNKETLVLTECHQLPVEYGVLSGDFAAQSIHKDLVCTTCGFKSPKIVVYPAIADSWESFMKTRKAVFSKWDNVRSTIAMRAEHRKDSLISFSVAMLCCFLVLYCHEQRCQARQGQVATFSPSLLPLSLSEPTASVSFSGTSLVCESISCAVVSSPLSPTSTKHVIANTSSLHLLYVVLVISVASSMWYHLALTMGQYSSSFEWDPLVSLAVGYSWTTLVLLTGLQLIEYCHGLLRSDFCQLVRESCGVVFICVVITVGVPVDRQVVSAQTLVCLLAVVSSISSRQPHSALVRREDISVFLTASLVYYFSSYLMVFLNVPVVLRTVLIRSLGMLHFFVALFVIIAVLCGEHLSAIIRKATLSEKPSRRIITKYVRFISQFAQSSCSALKTVIVRPLGLFLICCLIAAIVIYVKLFHYHGSNVPRTSPYFCLHQRGKYLNADGGVSSGCGAREAFSTEYPYNAVFSETFSQKYVCVQNTKPVPQLQRSHYHNNKGNWWDLVFTKSNSKWGGNSSSWWDVVYSRRKEFAPKRYLHPSLVVEGADKVGRCVPDTQFVFILPPERDSKKLFCLYNSRNGKFLTSSTSNRFRCGQTEKWEVVPTHFYIYVLNKVASLFYPLKYRFSYLNPFLSIGLMVALCSLARKIERYPYAKVSLYSTVAILFLYLFHVVTVWIIWGNNFDNMRQFNTDTMMSFQRALGVLTGPQYFRTITMLPDECPESLWFMALLFFTSVFPVFLVLLSCIQKRKLSEGDEEFLHCSRDSGDAYDDDVQSEKDLSFNVSIMSRVASSAIGSLLLETLFNLVLPVQYLASAHTTKSSCTNFEDRFGIIGFDKEYVDTVVLFTNIIFLMGMKYSTSPIFFSFCVTFSIILYVLVWLTVECSYFLFVSKFCITTVAWVSISHKFSSHFEFLILRKRKVPNVKRMGNRHRSMPNMNDLDSYMVQQPKGKYKQLTRNQSSFFKINE